MRSRDFSVGKKSRSVSVARNRFRGEYSILESVAIFNNERAENERFIWTEMAMISYWTYWRMPLAIKEKRVPLEENLGMHVRMLRITQLWNGFY